MFPVPPSRSSCARLRRLYIPLAAHIGVDLICRDLFSKLSDDNLRGVLDPLAGRRPDSSGPPADLDSLLCCKRRLKTVVCPFRTRYREFESSFPRHRVLISGDPSLESRNSPPQRPHLHICGRGENHFRVIDGQFAGNISDANFGATVWAAAERELRRTTRRKSF
jgi:hypothetical protein